MPSRTYPRIAALSTAAVVATWGLAAPAGALPGDQGRSAEAPGQVKKSEGKQGQGAKAPQHRGNHDQGHDKSQGKSQGKAQDKHRGKSAAKSNGKSESRGHGGAKHTPQGPKPAKPAKGPQSAPAAPEPKPAPGAGKGRGAKDGDPAGNNGTVKIEHLGDNDGIPNNTPHPGCTFQVEWYGFDEGSDVVSQVSFASQAPTAATVISVAGDTSVPVGGDPASGAGTDSGLDGVETYTLSFDGEPHPKQGYHVKLTVSTPRSQGNDTKTKVFWVEPCETAPAPGTDVPPTDTDTDTDTDTGTDTGTDTTTGPDQGVGGTFATADEVTSGSVAGTNAEADSADAAAESDAAVPNSVDAGSGNPVVDLASSPAGLLLVGLGLALTGAGVLLRRRGTI